MKNKKFFLGMAVLLGVSLFFLGCPSDTDDGGGSTTGGGDETATDADKLKEALGGDATIDADGKVVLSKNVVLAQAVEVGADAVLVVPENVKLTVAAGGTLTVNGTVSVASGGTFIAPPLGDDSLPAGGEGDGVISFGSDGKIEVAQGATLGYGNGTIIYFVSADAGDTVIYKWDTTSEDGKITLKTGNVTELEGSLSVAADDTGIAVATTAIVKSKATLTVPAGKTFRIGGTLTVAGTLTMDKEAVGVNGGTVQVKSGGILTAAGFTSPGNVVVESGGKVHVILGIYQEEAVVDFRVGLISDEDARFQLEAGATLTYSDTAFSLDGKATLTKDTGFYASSPFTLKAGSELTAKGGITVRLETAATGAVQPLVGEPGAKVILKQGAKWFLSTDWQDGTNENPVLLNIYDSKGTALGFNNGTNLTPDPVASDTTYNWDASADGESTPGWKEQAAAVDPVT
jgi:hypothetical protein